MADHPGKHLLTPGEPSDGGFRPLDRERGYKITDPASSVLVVRGFARVIMMGRRRYPMGETANQVLTDPLGHA